MKLIIMNFFHYTVNHFVFRSLKCKKKNTNQQKENGQPDVYRKTIFAFTNDLYDLHFTNYFKGYCIKTKKKSTKFNSKFVDLLI